ncbi:MAG: hypothetical protein ACUVR3_12205, partial [Candidatus Roseilinea sp.]|uniref:hypothetical protein n=1 Tax=Candidatus Roseilinea sp. TaxID=2838777 RepID=UPI00404935FC
MSASDNLRFLNGTAGVSLSHNLNDRSNAQQTLTFAHRDIGAEQCRHQIINRHIRDFFSRQTVNGGCEHSGQGARRDAKWIFHGKVKLKAIAVQRFNEDIGVRLAMRHLFFFWLGAPRNRLWHTLKLV